MDRALSLEASGVSGKVEAVGRSGEGVREVERGEVAEVDAFVVALLVEALLGAVAVE